MAGKKLLPMPEDYQAETGVSVATGRNQLSAGETSVGEHTGGEDTKDGDSKLVHYEGYLGSFDYDPTQFKVCTIKTKGYEENGEFEVLRYIGKETDGSKIHIPDGLENGSMMFMNTDITSMPELPSSLKSGFSMFHNCKKLTDARGVIPDIEDASYMFANCTNLQYGPTYVPGSVQDASFMFSGCASLKQAPHLKEGIKCGDYMFANCESLKRAPNIPKSMESSEHMLYGCSGIMDSLDKEHNEQMDAAREKYAKSLQSAGATHGIKFTSMFSAVMQTYAMSRMGYNVFMAPMMVQQLRRSGNMSSQLSSGFQALAMTTAKPAMYGQMAYRMAYTARKYDMKMGAKEQARQVGVQKDLRAWDAVHKDGLTDGDKGVYDMRREAVKHSSRGLFTKIQGMSYSERRPYQEQYTGVNKYREKTLDTIAKENGGQLPPNVKKKVAKMYEEQLAGFHAYHQQGMEEIQNNGKYKEKDRQKAEKGLDTLSKMQMEPLMESAQRMQAKYGIFTESQMRKFDKAAKLHLGQKDADMSGKDVRSKEQAIRSSYDDRMSQMASKFGQFVNHGSSQKSGDDFGFC